MAEGGSSVSSGVSFTTTVNAMKLYSSVSCSRVSVVISGHQRSSAVISGHQWSSMSCSRVSVVISGHQWPSVVISDHQWSSVVIHVLQPREHSISSNQRHSEVLRSNQKYSTQKYSEVLEGTPRHSEALTWWTSKPVEGRVAGLWRSPCAKTSSTTVPKRM